MELPAYPARRTLALLAAGMLVFAGCSAERGDDADATASAPAAATQQSRDATADGEQSTVERPVDAETLPYAEVGEELVYGHFAFPSDMIEPLPAIIIVHDWWGLNDDIRAAASRLAAQGYMVLAVDLYGGETVDSVEQARAKMIAVVENPNAVESNLSQALDFVGIAGAPRKAALGWGFGGSWALNSAIMFPDEIDAAVMYYGQVSDDESRLQTIDAPILGFFGAKDRGIKIETVRAFEQAMQRLRKPLTVQIYPEVGHAFADPARSNYSPHIAEAAWKRTIEFLALNLAAADDA